MTPNEYLAKILANQTLDENGTEVTAMEKHRDDITQLLQDAYESSNPLIKYAGSRAKGTMIKDSYDLDVVCYFDNDDTAAGDTLEDIFNNVKRVLKEKYEVEAKTSAIRIKSKEKDHLGEDFHIDVVPGRFTDDTKHDAFLYVKSKEKGRQKTNLKKHIKHIKSSGVVDTIRLAKFWNVREGLGLKTFVLELLVVKALKDKNDNDGFDSCLKTFWAYLRDHRASLCVEDPANPYGNDLSDYIDGIRDKLCDAAEEALDFVDADKWESIFGSAETMTRTARIEVLNRTVQTQTNPAKPWVKQPGS